MPLVAFMSSVSGLLALEQLGVNRKTWEATDESQIIKKRDTMCTNRNVKVKPEFYFKGVH